MEIKPKYCSRGMVNCVGCVHCAIAIAACFAYQSGHWPPKMEKMKKWNSRRADCEWERAQRDAFYERTAAKGDDIWPIFVFRSNVFVSNIYDCRLRWPSSNEKNESSVISGIRMKFIGHAPTANGWHDRKTRRQCDDELIRMATHIPAIDSHEKNHQ